MADIKKRYKQRYNQGSSCHRANEESLCDDER